MTLAELVLSANTGADAIKKAPIVEKNTGLRCLRIGDVSQKREYSEWGFTKTTEADYMRYKLEPGDLIIARTGNTIGVNCIIEDEINSVYNNGLIRIKVDESKVIPRYFWYMISSKNCQDFIQSIAYGTSTQPNMKIKDFLKYSFEYRDLTVQKKVVGIIDPIDKKIKTNMQINRNLLEQAVSLFKEKIWSQEKNGTIGEYCSIKSGFAFKSSWWTDEGVKVIKIGDISQDNLSLETCSHVYEDKVEKAKEYSVVAGDLVLAMTGATIGKFAMVSEINEPIFVNQRVGKFFLGNEPLKKVPFIYCTLKMDDVYSEVITRGQGSAQPNISGADIMTIPCVIPTQNEIDEFNSFAEPIFTQLAKNQSESKKLALLRDSLLPKLMSGELDVSDLDI